MTTLEVVETIEVDQLIISQYTTTVEILPYDMLGTLRTSDLKAVVAASTDFNDLKARIALM